MEGLLKGKALGRVANFLPLPAVCSVVRFSSSCGRRGQLAEFRDTETASGVGEGASSCSAQRLGMGVLAGLSLSFAMLACAAIERFEMSARRMSRCFPSVHLKLPATAFLSGFIPGSHFSKSMGGDCVNVGVPLGYGAREVAKSAWRMLAIPLAPGLPP